MGETNVFVWWGTSYEQQYIAAVDRWWGALLSVASEYGYNSPNKGPIVITQIENEYGSFGDCASNPNDAKYMNHLLGIATRFFGSNMTWVFRHADTMILFKGSDLVLSLVCDRLKTATCQFSFSFAKCGFGAKSLNREGIS
jgi:hypothetical protein